MKCSPVLVLLSLAAATYCVHANDNKEVPGSNGPIYRVVNLLRKLSDEITLDGKMEQQAYDKYSCWVEDVTSDATARIKQQTIDIASDQERILKLTAEIATGKTSLKNLEDDIDENIAAQKEAADKRKSDHAAYTATMKENVACKNALIEAIKVLKFTGTGSFLARGKSLGAIQEVQVLSIVGGVRKALKHFTSSLTVSEDDMNVVQAFVDKPADFFGKNGMSAAQVSEAHNPFGDYSPGSTRIQGILKGMLEAFTADIAKNMKEEAEAVREYEALSATRQRELGTLETTERTEDMSVASKTELLQETREDKKQTEEELAEDEVLLETTKTASRAKAKEWSERCRLRSEELLGIKEAIDILTGGKSTFVNAMTSFFEVSSVQVVKAKSQQSRMQSAYMQLQALATRYHSLRLAKIATSLQAGGHFDKVIAMIDQMMELLRKEEASDIFHKDRCESSENANENEMEDLDKDLGMNANAMTALQTEMNEAQASIRQMKIDMQDKEGEMDEQLEMRNADHRDFAKALKDDVDAIALIERAIVALSKYYTKNKLKLGGFVQQGANPVYAIDPEKAPELEFSKADSKSSASGGIIAILEMIKEDLEKEVKTAREEEAEDEAAFEASKSQLQASIQSLEVGIAQAEGKKADASSDYAAASKLADRKQNDLDDQQKLKDSLLNDCDWVKSHFQSRYEKRKSEMQGLTDAKAYLSGIA
mmetsp:Transcript_140520/g.262071  ORF Transcript_140520/g.262071 Transcript_140520/m.262071 type:complete len:710 (-) Transcript_140520:49-2178(-)